MFYVNYIIYEVVVIAGGRTECCCGRSSLWEATHTPQYLSNDCLTFCGKVIAWSGRTTPVQSCECSLVTSLSCVMIGDVMLLRVDRYNMMQECWNENPLHRPTFADIVHDLDRIVAMSSRDVSLTLFKIITPVHHSVQYDCVSGVH